MGDVQNKSVHDAKEKRIVPIPTFKSETQVVDFEGSLSTDLTDPHCSWTHCC
jgi:hypothetical protein